MFKRRENVKGILHGGDATCSGQDGEGDGAFSSFESNNGQDGKQGDGATFSSKSKNGVVAVGSSLRLSAGGLRVMNVPKDYGLLLRLDSTSGNVYTHFELDHYEPSIHPNCYVPKACTDIEPLMGGGSGTAVFHGVHPTLGSIVMKHGGAKEASEVFSLAEIAHELAMRSSSSKSSKSASLSSSSASSASCSSSDEDAEEEEQKAAAASYLKERIPEFVGCYISPHHVRDRRHEIWVTQRESQHRHQSMDDLLRQLRSSTTSAAAAAAALVAQEFVDDDLSDDEEASAISQYNCNHTDVGLMDKFRNVVVRVLKEKKAKRHIRVCCGDEQQVGFEVEFSRVVLYLPQSCRQDDNSDDMVILNGDNGGGYDFLKDFMEALIVAQDLHSWKVTLAQKTIGGPQSENGAHVLVSGKLSGELLTKTISEFTAVIQNLRLLTRDDERQAIDAVRQEVQLLVACRDVTLVSKACDEFVGTAIRKNFLPSSGRLHKLREIGQKFRQGDQFSLTDSEEFPAKCLGRLLIENVVISSVFQDLSLWAVSALDRMQGETWLDLLQTAVSFDNPCATNRVWTCGLTDAGLHNTFLSEDRGVELFDLGEPQLMPEPAFLTKFLMSFFHGLGMEDDTSSSNGGWVCRFDIVGNQLALTKATQDLLPHVYDSFSQTVSHFVKKLFNGDDRVGILLIRYAVLQLVSDASFCLGRWEQKGGGRERYGDRAVVPLDKWLWRSLWDLFIAADVYEKLLHVQVAPTQQVE